LRRKALEQWRALALLDALELEHRYCDGAIVRATEREREREREREMSRERGDVLRPKTEVRTHEVRGTGPSNDVTSAVEGERPLPNDEAAGSSLVVVAAAGAVPLSDSDSSIGRVGEGKGREGK